MKNLFRIAASLAALLVLAACGGGSDDSPVSTEKVGPVVVAPAPTPADITLTQRATVASVTPGESFVVTRLEVACVVTPGSTSCVKSVPLAELAFESNIALSDVKVRTAGLLVEGYVQVEGNLYRFVPFYNWQIWEQGIIEIEAVASPRALKDQASVVVLHATSGSFDKKVEVAGKANTFTVLPIAGQTPVEVTASSVAYTTVPEWGQAGSFTVKCPERNYGGCAINRFDVTLYSSAFGSEVQVWIGDIYYTQTFVNDGGVVVTGVYPNMVLGAGETITVKIFGKIPEGGGVWVSNLETTSGGKKIAPILPTGPDACGLVISDRNGCKG